MEMDIYVGQIGACIYHHGVYEMLLLRVPTETGKPGK